MPKIAPNPATIRTLTNDERAHLLALHPDLTPSPEGRGCPTCRGQGAFKWRDAKGAVVVYECDCTAQWMLHRFLLNAGLGLSHQRMSWEDVLTVPKGVIDAVLDYYDDREANVRAGRSLILWGKALGTGKTLLEVLLTKKLIADGYDCYFTPFHGLLDSYAAGWRDPDQRRWFNRRVTNAGVLVIDDVGRERRIRRFVGDGLVEYHNEMAESTLEFVIRDRVNADKPTFITTNLSPEQMRRGYGGHVMSLLAEVSETIEVRGDDFREQARDRMAADIRAGLVRPVVLVDAWTAL